MFSQPSQICFKLPEWLNVYCQSYQPSSQLEDRMDFVIAAAAENISRQTGGPFAAGIFERDSGQLVSLGVNIVCPQQLSILHAEMVAMTLAERKLNTFSLKQASLPAYELISSAEPCAMCLGAIPWSGIAQVVTAACDKDIRAIGFDEGGKPDHWQQALTSRGIKVVDRVQRQQACEVLQQYERQQGLIYNN
ncbi:MAG: tRNA-specific adenosine deaminase [Oceanospirillaceae bacterium]|nr:tRNA-specific adenosine deaminase [Oceanospirillaceae bacterium]